MLDEPLRKLALFTAEAAVKLHPPFLPFGRIFIRNWGVSSGIRVYVNRPLEKYVDADRPR
jgi:hypothetical protein